MTEPAEKKNLASLSLWERASRALPYLSTLCLLVYVTPARADNIIGDLSAGNNGTNAISNAIYWASSFTMGSNAYSLTDIQIVLAGTPNGISFALESDGGTIPSDTVLLALNSPTFTTGILTYTFTPGSPFILEPNTIYWLVATSSTVLPVKWENGAGDQIPTGAGATYGTRTETSDSGLIWGGAANNTNLFEVDGTLVQTSAPEPSSAGLAAIGSALFLLAIGRKTFALRRLQAQRHRS